MEIEEDKNINREDTNKISDTSVSTSERVG